MTSKAHVDGVAQTISVTDFASWRALVSQSFVPLNVTARSTGSFAARLRSRSLGDVFVSEVGANPHSVERTPDLIAAGNAPFFKLSLQLAGTALLMQDGREAVLSPGIAPGTAKFKEFMDKYGTSQVMFDQSFFPALRGYDYSRLPDGDNRWVIYSRGQMIIVDPTPKKRGSN